MNMKKLKFVFLTVIILVAAVVRFYKLDSIPPSLNWDEVAAGYNAYTIANWGADEYGNRFPIVFKSFGDDKHPVHIYLTAPIVKIFDLSDYSTRSGSALIGVLSVLAIYFLSKALIKSELAGLFAALFLAVSPYAIHFSRGLWETNFALAFFIGGLAAFFWGIKKSNWLVPLSFLFFGLSFFSYHSAKVVVPPVVILLTLLHFKQIVKNKSTLVFVFLISLFFVGLTLKDPRILGFARINQTKFSVEDTRKYGGELGTVVHNYKKYFTYDYLFLVGDQGPRASVKVIGEFYKIDLILSLAGAAYLISKRKWEALAVIFSWLALSPIPGSVSTMDPSAIRGIFMVGPILILSSIGAAGLILLTKKRWARVIIALIIIIFLGKEASNYVNYYFTRYSEKEAIEWQYGMKDAALYASRNPQYSMVYVDKIRQQPYIFFLYYLKVPLPSLLKTVKYDNTEASSFNTVSSFGKYNFGNWNPIDSYPSSDILYVVTPSYYTGLRYFTKFNIKKLVKYPNGTDAFYIISGNE